jgi:phosphoenolpyruvate-protein kinase (PTS system EI component)
MLGTMIELPRAALRAGEIAEAAEFFSFATNDLTQTTFGLSRDDASSFLDAYEAAKIVAVDPFISLDQDGVGELIAIACQRGRAARPGLKLGICGEHGGDPASIGFCERTGLDYVSCSPYRVPIARLAAAQAALAEDATAKVKPKPGRAAAASDDRHRRVLIAASRRSAARRVSLGKGMTRPPARSTPKPKTPAKAKKRAAPKPPARKRGGGKPKRGGKRRGPRR